MDIKIPHTCHNPEICCTLYDLNIRRTCLSHTIPCTPQDLKIRNTCCITDIRCTPFDVTIRPTCHSRTVPCRSQEVIIRNTWRGHFGRQSIPRIIWVGLEYVRVVYLTAMCHRYKLLGFLSFILLSVLLASRHAIRFRNAPRTLLWHWRCPVRFHYPAGTA